MSEKKGLYYSIQAKRKRIAAGSGERMRKVGEAGAPTAAQFKQAAKTAKAEDGMMINQKAKDGMCISSMSTNKQKAKDGMMIPPMSAMNAKMMSNQKAGDLKRSISFYAKKINKY